MRPTPSRQLALGRVLAHLFCVSCLARTYKVSGDEQGSIRAALTDDEPSRSLQPHWNAGRLFVHMLSSRGHTKLCGALAMLDETIFSATPGDVFVFSGDNSARQHVQKSCPAAVKAGVLNFKSLTADWATPKEAANNSDWQMKGFDEDYRRMGHWRLVHPIGLARGLGYKWVLQMDVDSEVNQVLGQNIVEELNSHHALLAGRALEVDIPTWGLPELTRYFLVAEQKVPETLFQYCKPHNIDGLFTLSSEGFPGDLDGDPALSLPAREAAGWNRTVIYGNFVAISTDFWFQEDVQKYLALVLRVGAHFRFRWNEQGVMAMIWQIFVPATRFHCFDFAYRHQGHIYGQGEQACRT